MQNSKSAKSLANRPVLRPIEGNIPLRPKAQMTSNSTSSLHKIVKAEERDNAYNSHLQNTLKSLRIIKSLPTFPQYEIDRKIVHIPRRVGFRNTLVLDLDETLIHCNSDPATSHITLVIPGQEEEIGINIRPFAKDCLIEVSKYYEIIIFTASRKYYADTVLDYLDPTNTVIHHRLYRGSCIQRGDYLVKDLRILRRSLKRTVIVDNNVLSFANQLNNGIPIISWYDDMNDSELFKLTKYLKALANVKDMRLVNNRTFRLDRLDQLVQSESNENTVNR